MHGSIDTASSVDVTFLRRRKGEVGRDPPLLPGLPDGVQVRQVVVWDGHNWQISCERGGDAPLAVEKSFDAPPSYAFPAHLMLGVHEVLVEQFDVSLVGRDELHPLVVTLRLAREGTNICSVGTPGAAIVRSAWGPYLSLGTPVLVL